MRGHNILAGMLSDDSGVRLASAAAGMLRTLQSFILEPGGASRRGHELRGLLHRWIAPAVQERSGQATRPR